MVAAFLVVAAAGGCAGTEPCGTSASCAAGTVCQPGGTCAPLESEARFVRGRWLHAIDWGGTRDDRPSEALSPTDVLPLGGDRDAVAYLAFGPITPEPRVRRALLTLHPHPTAAGPHAAALVSAHRTRAFEGAELTLRHRPAPLGSAVAVGRVLAGGPRPIVLDVTDAVRQAQATGRARVSLSLRVTGGDRGPAWLLASPRATDPDLRPRLDLWVM